MDDGESEVGDLPSRPGKRQRVARACANCRRRKTRCDGNEPCESCRTSDISCAYDAGRRMTSTTYIQSLEKKIDELEGLLGRTRSKAPRSNGLTLSRADTAASDESGYGQDSDEDVIETMVDAGEMPSRDVSTPKTPTWDRRPGSFAGLSLLRRVHDLCKHVSGSRPRSNGDDAFGNSLTDAFDVAPPESDSITSWEAFALLPSREKIEFAIDVVVNQACCNMQFLDHETLRGIVDEIYRETDGDTKPHARKPLSLVYAVLALSRRFDPRTTALGDGKAERTMAGLRYFRASRTLLDPSSCQDMVSLRALLCMILYTQASSMMSTCYSYICMAVAASLQMGLFTDLNSNELSDRDKGERRTIFSVLYIVDTYVTTALGLPRTLRDMEPERGLPGPFRPTGVRDPLYGTYAHAQLIQILAETVESNHPVTRPIEQKNGFYGVEYSKIATTEDRLEAWHSQLLQSSPTEQGSGEAQVMRSQLMLRLYYAHVQMVLYRPFLHHALKGARKGNNVSIKAYACGSACIKAAMQVVWLAERMEASNLFNAAHWFVTLIMAYTAACLVLFVTSNDGDPTVDDTAAAVRRLKDLCSRHAGQNNSMRRCFKFLESVPPNELGSDDTTPVQLWNSFNENMSTFNEAFQAPDDVEAFNIQGDNMIQALSLPQLQPFLSWGL